jgi:hypothetical protein
MTDRSGSSVDQYAWFRAGLLPHLRCIDGVRRDIVAPMSPGCCRYDAFAFRFRPSLGSAAVKPGNRPKKTKYLRLIVLGYFGPGANVKHKSEV